jgi:hypothetical protein
MNFTNLYSLRVLLFACLLASACADRQHRNPLDPLGDFSDNSVTALAVLAGDDEVVLRWDYTHFTDIAGYQIYRSVGSGDFVEQLVEPLGKEAKEFVDLDVENGITYAYRLALLVENEGERFVDFIQRATPGPETAWVADQVSGVVWKLSPDGRAAQLSVGRFPDMQGVALDRQSGELWVSDRFLQGLQIVDPMGDLRQVEVDIDELGVLSFDIENRIGWLGDNQRQEVNYFALENGVDTLALTTIDAHFEAVSLLAAAERQCWIADEVTGRALLYSIENKQLVEFTGLDGIGGLAAGLDGQGWILVEEGATLIRLDRAGGLLRLQLPAAGGRALAVDRVTGNCWVAGASDIIAYSPQGNAVIQWSGLDGGRAIAIDEVQRRVWVGAGGALWKFTMEGQQLVRLGGFVNLFGVEINPGI